MMRTARKGQMVQSNRKLSVVIAGTRGIPAAYGGFETFAEELGVRLAERGHDVTVFQRHPFFRRGGSLAQHRGVQRRSSPTVFHKYLETPLAALTSFLSLLRSPPDVVLLCNAANSPFAWLLRLRGIPIAINVDGIERKRQKWSLVGRLWYQLGEWCSVLFGSKVVADAEVIAKYYREKYHIEPATIAYGAEERFVPPGVTLKEFNLDPHEYILYVSRLEPENNALGVIEAYARAQLSVPLVVVGDAPYAHEYKARLRALADQVGSGRVVFTGFRFGEAYRELRSHCGLYIQATEVGGTHPALLEAMAHGNPILANEVPEHAEVIADAGVLYPKNDFVRLGELMRDLWNDATRRTELGARARARALELYDWSRIADQYERLLDALVSHRPV